MLDFVQPAVARWWPIALGGNVGLEDERDAVLDDMSTR